MRLYKTRNQYEASNVTFNVETKEARSYKWWAFVKVIKGKVIFNNYRYSNSTAKHQSKVRNLLRELGINIDRTVQVRHGLQDITSLKELNKFEKRTLGWLADRAEEKRLERNAKAKARRAARKEQDIAIATHNAHDAPKPAIEADEEYVSDPREVRQRRSTFRLVSGGAE